MYTSFYKLGRKPFEINPDLSFLWLGDKHKEALSTLRYGALDNKGFLLLTGDAGTGKTTLINALVDSFGEDVEWAVIADPNMERIDFYNAIANGFGLDKQFASKVQFLIQFSHFLHKADDEKKRVVLLVDDCHKLSQEMLEELRLLSNIEKADSKLINIFFIGQRDFNDTLVQPKNRAVRQRLTLKAEIPSLSVNETEDYIRHRLKVAGTTEKLFSVKAIQLIHRYSQGVPRNIHIICDAALTAGAAQGAQVIDHGIIEEQGHRLSLSAGAGRGEAVAPMADTGGDRQPGERVIPITGESTPAVTGFNLEAGKGRAWWKYGAAVLLLLVVFGGSFFFFSEPSETTVSTEAESAPEKQIKKESQSLTVSPAVAVLENDKVEINRQKAEQLKTAILKKAYDNTGEQSPSTGSSGLAAQPPKTGKDEPVSQPAVADTMAKEDVADALPSAKYQGILAKESDASQKAAEVVVPAPPETSTSPAATPDIAQGVKTPQPAASGDQLQTDGAVATVIAEADPSVAAATEPKEPAVAETQPQVPLEPRKILLPLQANSTKLTSAAQREFDDFVKKLALYPRATLMVKGFVSSKSNSPENIQLSADRAKTVLQLLVAEGIDEERIEVKGMGNQEPLATNDTSKGRRKNRRVEIIVVDDGY